MKIGWSMLCFAVFSSAAAGAYYGTIHVYPDSNRGVVETLSSKEMQSFVLSEIARGNLLPVTSLTDGAGVEHRRYIQYYKKTPVFGGYMVVEYRNGSYDGVSGEYFSIGSLDTKPYLSAGSAGKILTQAIGLTDLTVESSELTIFPLSEKTFKLAYRIAVIGGSSFREIGLVDATTGAILYRYPGAASGEMMGSGWGFRGEACSFPVTQEDDGLYYMQYARNYPDAPDDFPPFNVTLFDELLVPGQRVIPSSLDGKFPQHYRNNIEHWVSETGKVLWNHFQYCGIDGHDNVSLIITVLSSDNANDAMFMQEGETAGSFDGGFHIVIYPQANLKFGPKKGVVLPTGVIPGTCPVFVSLPGMTSGAALDIIAHEFGHGIIAFNSNLNTGGFPGALNEAFGDILGTVVEFSLQPEGNGFGCADWYTGEDAFDAFRVEEYDAVHRPFQCNRLMISNMSRNLANPHQYNWLHRRFPALLEDPLFPGLINEAGDVHFNSTIISHGFYLLAHSGENRNVCNCNDIVVRGIDFWSAAQIFFDAFVRKMGPPSDFYDAAQFLMQSANEQFGFHSNEYRQTRKMLNAVGIFTPFNFVPEFPRIGRVWRNPNAPVFQGGIH